MTKKKRDQTILFNNTVGRGRWHRFPFFRASRKVAESGFRVGVRGGRRGRASGKRGRGGRWLGLGGEGRNLRLGSEGGVDGGGETKVVMGGELVGGKELGSAKGGGGGFFGE